jgi:hypothetical protein
MESEELAAFMNKYYAAVFDPVKLHGGMVSNVVGDSMLALWLTTKENPPSFSSACLAAIEIDHALAEFNRSRPRLELPTRIYEYRPIGDIVNTATRIEGLNKQLGTQILVSEEVVSQANKFLARDLGKFLLVGKSKPVHVYELVSRQVDSSPRQRDYLRKGSSRSGARPGRMHPRNSMKRSRSGTATAPRSFTQDFALAMRRTRPVFPGTAWSGWKTSRQRKAEEMVPWEGRR